MASSTRDAASSSPMTSSMFTPDPSASNSTTTEEGPASFFCRQCLSAFRRPRILKCLHSFCTQCLEAHLAQAKKTAETKGARPTAKLPTLSCPLCSHLTPLPVGGIEDLPLNSFLERVSSEYVAGVKSNLASKSSASGHTQKGEERENKNHDHEQNNKSSMLSKPTSSRKEVSFHDDVGFQTSASANLTDEQKFNSSLRAPTTSESPQTVQEAVQNLGRLHAKLVGLQGEALKVTYAIDRVNHHKIAWLQHREDVKRTIQRRSAQFQMMVKKIERQLIAQIDDKNVEGRLYESFEKGKTELRKSLKQVLHEVAVMKGVKEMGSYAEINELSASLLGPSVGVNELVLDKVSYQFDLPTKSIDEMVSVGFGNLVKTTEERTVYRPELKDYTNMKIDEINAEAQQRSQSFALNRAGVVSAITGDSASKGKLGQRSSSLAGRQTQRRGSDIGRTSELEEFQNARESLRSRRQEILQQARPTTDTSPRRGDGKRLSRPSTRRGRGQSLDRGFSERVDRNQAFLRLQAERRERQIKGVGGGGDTSEDDDHETSSTSSTETGAVGLEHRSKSGLPEFGSQTFKSEITMPSPIIEEKAPLITSPAKTVAPALVSSSMAATATNVNNNQSTKPSSPGGGSISSTKISSFQELLQARGSPNSPSSSASSSRRVSFDRSPSMSPTAEYSMFPDHLGKGVGEGSRHLRRAITSAADKRAKIEFLRENWQKRKEILIQNQGFVSTEEVKSPKPDASTVKALISGNATSTEGVTKTENGVHHTQIPLASRGIGSPPLRSKFTSAKKSQLEQKKFNEKSSTEAAKLSPKRTNEVSRKSSNFRSTALHTSNTEGEDEKKVETISPSVRSRADENLFDFTDKPTETDNYNKEEEDEEEEEEVVVQTETIIVPITQELTKNEQSGEGFHSPAMKRAETSDFYSKTSEITTNDEDRKDRKEKEEINYSISSTHGGATNSSLPNVPLTLRTESAETTGDATETDDGDSLEVSGSGANLSSVDSRTRTLTPTSATVSVSPVDNKSAELSSLIAEVAAPPTPHVTTSRQNNSSLDNTNNTQLAGTSNVKVEPLSPSSSSSSSSPLSYVSTTFQKGTSLLQSQTGPPSLSTSNTATNTSASSNPANSNSTTTQKTTTTTTSQSTSTLTTTTTSSVSTSTSTSAPTTSSRSSYYSSSRYYRSYAPATSPFAHLYGPPAPTPVPAVPTPAPATTSATTHTTEKSKSDDNKENIISSSQSGTSSTLSNQSNQINERSQVHSQPSNRLYSSIEDKPHTVTEKSTKDSDERETSDSRQRQSNYQPSTAISSSYYQPTTHPSSPTTVGSQRSTTVQNIANANTFTSQEPQTTTRTTPTASDSSPASTFSEKDNSTTTDTEAPQTSTTPLSQLQAKNTSGSSSSMYSRFYSHQSALYPKSPETKPKQSKLAEPHQEHESSQDKRVDETFTHAESTRRLYDPATASKLSRSRRHTVEVGKTLPTGVKILDLYDSERQLYQGQEVGEDTNDLMRSPSQRTTDTIQEARIEESDTAEMSTLSDTAGQRHVSQRPRIHHSQPMDSIMPSSMSLGSASFSRGRIMPPRQHSLPDKPEVRFAAETSQKQYRSHERPTPTIPTSVRQKQTMAPSYSATHLSTTSSSPAGSPVVEDKKFLLSREDSGSNSSISSSSTTSAGVDSSSKSIKDIARKKRERWRRLTVY